MKTRMLLIALFAIVSFQVGAQTNDEVTLVVSADGATKEEATTNALRSAIEQAYGVFVSANTKLVNDELIKDEIATISSGNIKNYSEISTLAKANGGYDVTLKATVCISRLVSYAQSKGATTEFAGATFAMNMKILELRKENERKALNHFIDLYQVLLPKAYDKKIEIENPKIISLSDLYRRYSYIEDETWATYVSDSCYEVKITVQCVQNNRTEEIYNNLREYLRQIAITTPYDSPECRREKRYELDALGIQTYYFAESSFLNNTDSLNNVKNIFDDHFPNNFIIRDNLGEVFHFSIDNGNTDWEGIIEAKGNSVFSPRFVCYRTGVPVRFSDIFYHDTSAPGVEFLVYIPKKNISKYTNFTVEDY